MQWHQVDPLLRLANFYDATARGGFGPRHIQDHQVLFVQDGQGVARVGSHIFHIAPGDLVYYGPDTVHEVQADAQVGLCLIGLHLLFDRRDIALLPQPDCLSRPDPWYRPRQRRPRCPAPAPPALCHPGHAGIVRRACESLVLSYLASSGQPSLEQRGWLLLLLHGWHELCQADGRVARPDDARLRLVELAIDKIRKRLDHPPTTAELAADVGLSPPYFARLFKRCTGRRIVEQVNLERMHEARRLLIGGVLNVAQVAHRLGFDDALYFSRRFTRCFGVAPSHFRRRHQLT